ncbi:MAG: TRAP transporter small permease subunit, partial [Calditrichota bacterium]
MKKVILVVDTILKWFLIIIMGANVLNVLWQVFTRFILNNPSSFTEELARYLLIWVGVLGAAYAHRLKMHLAIDVLTDRCTGNSHYYSRILIESCVFLFALFVMLVGGANLVVLTLTFN